MEIEELQAILEEKDAGGGDGVVHGEKEEIKYTTEEFEEEIEEEIEIIEEEIEVDEGEEYAEGEYVEDDGETEYVTEILEEEKEELAEGNEQSIEAMVESMDSLGEQETDVKQHDEQLNGDNANSYDAVVTYQEWQEDENNDPLGEQQQQQSIKQIKNEIISNGSSTKLYRSKKSKNTVQYEQQMQIPRHDDEDDMDNNVDGEINQTLVEQDEYEDENPHEIVKNTENNLVYTVLGTNNKKKNDEGANFRMEKLDEGTVPVEGTVYYEGDDMRTYYVAQTYNENEQYFDEQVLDTDEQQDQQQQDQQQWEESTDNIVTDELEQEQSNENPEQVYLLQDEQNNLYFEDENGKMRLVYMTEDGNYEFHTSSDEQEATADEQMAIQDYENQNNQVLQDDNNIGNDIDNENDNNTVEISLIISEDENGLKRTQVIIPTNDSLKCEICHRTFKSHTHLLKHRRLKHAREEDITVRNFPCDLCDKKFPDQNSLATHRKMHTGDRPFSCLECYKLFPTKEILRRHMIDHNPNSKPLPCIYCARRFMDKDTLEKHEKSHLAGEPKNFHCNLCSKSFITAQDLAIHKRSSHDPDKKHKCEVCGREFNRLNNLHRHLLVHEQPGNGKQPVETNSKKETPDEILSCDVCGITYKFMSSLTRHMVTSHVNPERMRQQAEEQRRKRESNYKRYLENRKMYETQHAPVYGKRAFRTMSEFEDDDDEDYEMA